MIMTYRYIKPKTQCVRNLQYNIRLIKNGCFKYKCQDSEKCVHFYIHWIIGWGSSCMNSCINVTCHRGDQPVVLHRCHGSPDCFNSCLQVICLVEWIWCLSPSSWQQPTDFLWSSGHGSFLASQEQPGCWTSFWNVWQCGQMPSPAGTWKQHFWLDGCVDLAL